MRYINSAYKEADIIMQIKRSGRVLKEEKCTITDTDYFSFSKIYQTSELQRDYEIDVIVDSIRFNNAPVVVISCVIMGGAVVSAIVILRKAKKEGEQNA